MGNETENAEGRRAKRQRVLKTAKIYRVNGSHAVDCTVRDLSETGARLICKDQVALPNEFKFVLPMDNCQQMARVVWRKGDLAGIQFTSEKSPMTKERLQDGSMI